MSYKSAKNGWYKVLNAGKFISQMKESKAVMKSTRIVEGFYINKYKKEINERQSYIIYCYA